MKKRSLNYIAAVAVGLMLCSALPAAAAELQNRLRDNRVTTRLMKLDRVDGFFYGLSIRSPDAPALLIAPGSQGRWLVQIDGAEAILESAACGSLQVIAADEDTELFICRLKVVTTFLLSLRNCALTDRLCRVDKFLTLLIGWNLCIPPEDED